MNEFRKEMLSDKHIKLIHDFTNSNDCFPTNDINGGVCYFLRCNNELFEKCIFINTTNGITTFSKRDLTEFPILIRFHEALGIVKKVVSKSKKFLSDGFVSPQTPYGFLSTFKGNEKREKEDDVEYMSSKGWSYVSRNLIQKGIDSVDKFKVYISKLTCEHAGQPDKNGQYRVISNNGILSNGQICSQSYLIICPADTLEEAENVLKYLRTKFARFLIQVTLAGMNMSIDNFCYVPYLNFKEIYTDESLYKEFNLTNDEINFIEKTIREMN